MSDYLVSLTLWVTAPGDASLSEFVDSLRRQLLRLHEQGCIGAPLVTGHVETRTCQVDIGVSADDITAAPLAAGRAVMFAADHAASAWLPTIARITVQPSTARTCPPGTGSLT